MTRCRYCAAFNLTWRDLKGKWRLLNPDGTVHTCSGYRPDERPRPECNKCCKPGLAFRQFKGNWVLCEQNGEPHKCSTRKLSSAGKARNDGNLDSK